MKEQLRKEMQDAMREGDRQKVSILRMLISEIGYGETSSQPYDAVTAIKRYKKKVADSMFGVLDQEKIDTAIAEIKIIDQYLPKEPTTDEIKSYLNALSKAESFGGLMRDVKMRFPYGDGKIISELVKDFLNE